MGHQMLVLVRSESLRKSYEPEGREFDNHAQRGWTSAIRACASATVPTGRPAAERGRHLSGRAKCAYRSAVSYDFQPPNSMIFCRLALEAGLADGRERAVAAYPTRRVS